MKQLITAKFAAQMPEEENRHPLNSNAVRHYRSLGDAVGLTRLDVYLARLEPSREATEYHFHRNEEEFYYILSGRGVIEVNGQQHPVEAGDFVGFPCDDSPHTMLNPFDEDLVFLMVGERGRFDLTDYPKLGKRYFKFESFRKLVDLAE